MGCSFLPSSEDDQALLPNTFRRTIKGLTSVLVLDSNGSREKPGTAKEKGIGPCRVGSVGQQFEGSADCLASTSA
jgi:hypothetical protein